MAKIRIIVVPPGQSARIEEVESGSWKTWYPLVDKTTHLFQVLHLPDRIDMLFDEEGRLKGFPLNVFVPAKAPPAVPKDWFIINLAPGGMMPGEPGIGYFDILGTFILARSKGVNYVDLTDKDIKSLMGTLAKLERI